MKAGKTWIAAALAMIVLVAAGCGSEAPGSTGSGSSTATPTMALSLAQSDTGAASNAVTLASPLRATATVRNASGVAVQGALVQFQVQGSGTDSTALAVLNPASGNGLTDSQGQFSVTVSAGGVASQGAATLSASTTVNGTDLVASTNFQVGATGFSLGTPTFSPASIQAFQTSTVTVAVTGLPASVPISVSLTSICVAQDKATLPATVTTVAGVATATYTDRGCGRSDTVTVSATGATAAQGTIVVAAPQASNIKFVSATPDTIGIAGTGASSSSIIEFQVVDALQQGIANANLTFALETSVGGVAFDTSGATTATASTDASGSVKVNVLAGTQPGPVRVRASLGTLTALSSQLTIQSGLPTQTRFSLAVETPNIEGWSYDGVTTTITANAADRVGNPVPDGTVVNFRSSGALIEPSCRTTNGQCSVTFRSQEARWASNLSVASGLRGRIRVLAYAVGEEAFTDTNGNNRYDSGEPFVDLGDAFVDVNLDGVQETDLANPALNEEFIPFNAAAKSACPSTGSSDVPSKNGTCDGGWGSAHVRRLTTVVLSDSTPSAPVLSFYEADDNGNLQLENGKPKLATCVPGTKDARLLAFTNPAASSCSRTLFFQLTDQNGNAMPAGTTVSASAPDLTVKVTGSPVVSTSAQGTSVSIEVSSTKCSAKTASTPTPQNKRNLAISTKTPLGLERSFPFVCVIEY